MTQEWIQRHVPGYRIRTLALPMGAYPKDIRWAIEGAKGQVAYRHDAVLKVAGGGAPSPHARAFARAFDPYHLPRIQALESELAHWLLLRAAPTGALRQRRACVGDHRTAGHARQGPAITRSESGGAVMKEGYL